MPTKSDTRPCPKCGGTGRVSDDRVVGAKLRKQRKDHGRSLRSIAKAIGVSAAYLSDLELGNRHWDNELIDKFNWAVTE